MAYDYERDVKARSSAGEIDLGLKAYMNKVYSFMAVGHVTHDYSLFESILAEIYSIATAHSAGPGL